MDYGARHYDAALGRFTTMDPLAEKYYGVGPYAYCGNNPINRIDPDGKDWRVQTYYNKSTGKMEYTITVNAVLYNNSSDESIDMKQFQKEGKATARSSKFGLNIQIGTELAKETVENRNRRSVAHELGHTGGLEHLHGDVKDNLNLMRQTYHVKGDANKAVQLEYNQIKEIRDNYIHKRLKVISPVLTHRNEIKYLYK